MLSSSSQCCSPITMAEMWISQLAEDKRNHCCSLPTMNPVHASPAVWGCIYTHCSDFHPPPNKWSRFYLLNKQSYFQLSCVGFLEQKGWNSVIKHGEVGLHTLGTFSNLYDSEWAWWWWVDNRNLLAEQSIFFPPHFTCRSIYPSSVLASLEYLTLLLGIPAERFVLDGIITVRCGHQLEPGKQK